MTTWLTSYPTWWTSWTCLTSPGLDFVHLGGAGEDVGELSVNCGWGFSTVGVQPRQLNSSVGQPQHEVRRFGHVSKFCAKSSGRYEGERRGGPPYHPRMMVKVLLYGYCVGVSSSRMIAQRLHEDIAFRVLAANNTPDFRTIRDFRKDNLDALSGLFLQVLALCQQAGLVKLGHVALDGTKVKANASKHKPESTEGM